MKKRPLWDAFTLVELLVVITIIAALAGMLSPSLAAARRRGHAAVCMNNLKQLGHAIQMYWDENDGKLSGLSGTFPLWTDTGSTQAWTKLVYPYIKTTKVFLDPGRPKYLPELPIDYYLNLLPAYVAAGSPATGMFDLQSKEISNPSAFILLSEDLWINGMQEVDPTNERGDKTGFSGGKDNYPPFHLGFVNVLFADSHVAPCDRYNQGTMTYWYHTMANWQETKP
ncbi:MAG: type II secretion system protein [Verrucomicrobiae bacterium]|nr:type II secretion system protein [Verrucomicrobiae bacterium]